jgi:hypothetical protein
LALLPVALDLFLWLGPQVSIAPIVNGAIATARSAIAELPAPTGNSASLVDIDAMAELLGSTIGRTNILALGAWQRLGMPSLASGMPISASDLHVIQLDNVGSALGLQVASLGLGLLVAGLFLVLLAHDLRDDSPPPRVLLWGALSTWWRLVLVYLPLFAAMAFILTMGMLLGPLVLVAALGLLWLTLLLSFVPQAVALSDDGPLGAIASSVRIVRRNLLPTLGLLMLTGLLSNGLGLLFRRLFELGDLARVLSIAANSFVGTALTVSLFIFYRDRLAAWHQSLEKGIKLS